MTTAVFSAPVNRRLALPLSVGRQCGRASGARPCRSAVGTHLLAKSTSLNMKTNWNPLLLTSLLLFATLCRGLSAEAKKEYPATAARDALEAACKTAASEGKVVFVKSGFPECGWCRVFDRYHSLPDVQRILGKHYVIVAIDTKHMPDGEATFSKYAKPGAPSWVIISPQKKVIIDSYAPEGNVGYPLAPNETAYYIAALKKATPAMTEAELQTLSQQIKKAAAK